MALLSSLSITFVSGEFRHACNKNICFLLFADTFWNSILETDSQQRIQVSEVFEIEPNPGELKSVWKGLNFPRNSHKKKYGYFPCPNCDSVYNRHDNLTAHLKYVCHQNPRFSCPYCPYVTKRTYNVYGHIRYKHVNSNVYCFDLSNNNAILYPK